MRELGILVTGEEPMNLTQFDGQSVEAFEEKDGYDYDNNKMNKKYPTGYDSRDDLDGDG